VACVRQARSVKRADLAPIGFHPLNDPATCPAEGDGSLHTAEVSSCPECGSSRVRRITCSAIGEVANLSSCVPLKVEIFHCDECDFAQFIGPLTPSRPV
jgi:hypothetical protein